MYPESSDKSIQPIASAEEIFAGKQLVMARAAIMCFETSIALDRAMSLRFRATRPYVSFLKSREIITRIAEAEVSRAL
jgi:hypothetical protein